MPGGPANVWSCWETPPRVSSASPSWEFRSADDVRAEFLCGPSNPRRKTGTPLALDAPYPGPPPRRPLTLNPDKNPWHTHCACIVHALCI